MGFWDTQDAVSDGKPRFLSGDEKEDLAKAGTPFTITAVEFEVGKSDENPNGNKYGDRFVLTIDLDGEDRRLGFTIGIDPQTGESYTPARDKQLADMTEYLATGEGAIDPTKLVKVGRAYFLNPA